MRQQHSSTIFPFFIGINPPADPTIPMPSSSASVSSVMTRSLPSATATMSNTMAQSSVDEQGRQRSCDSPSGTGLELVRVKFICIYGMFFMYPIGNLISPTSLFHCIFEMSKNREENRQK
jgi:hypothetical protein